MVDCRNNHLIGPTNAKAIPDASLSGYNMYSTNVAYAARMNAGGWYGLDSTSYLQVDLGLYNCYYLNYVIIMATF